MIDTVVCSFWVHRPHEFPTACDYPAMLRILDASCKRVGYRHVVLTDAPSADYLWANCDDLGVSMPNVRPFELPRNLLQATTEAQAKWLESDEAVGVDSAFVGADCLILHDFRPFLRPADLSIVYFEHKKFWIMNGFIHVPANSRNKLVPIFREVANGTRPLPAETCDDMQSWERALYPRPIGRHYGRMWRRDLVVQFLEEWIWNGRPKSADLAQPDAHVLHFRGHKLKPVFFDWAKAHGYA